MWQKFPNPFSLFWHKQIMAILAFSKVAKFCYTFCHGQWQFLHADVCHIWQRCPLILYFYISAYIVNFGFFIMLAKQIWQKFTAQFCQFWYNSATHIGMNSGSFYMLMLAIFAKTSTIFILLYIYISAYIVGFGFFIMLTKFGKNSQFSNNGNQNPQ